MSKLKIVLLIPVLLLCIPFMFVLSICALFSKSFRQALMWEHTDERRGCVYTKENPWSEDEA